jgi:Ca2+-binding RTX toxin-like protein
MQNQSRLLTVRLTLNDTVEHGPDIDVFIFNAAQGGRISVTITDLNCGINSPRPYADVYDPDFVFLGRALPPDHGCSGALLDLSDPPLPKTGTYTILVVENGIDQTGGYDLSINCLSPPPGRNTCGIPPDGCPCPRTCGGLAVTIRGNERNNTIMGTAGNDVIAGCCGNDTIYGLGGNDVICGGLGNDTVYGGTGNDRLFGEAGRNRLFGGGGDDRLVGGPLSDVLVGGVGNDTLQGNQGADVLSGGTGADRLQGGDGADILIGGANADTLDGDAGVDVCEEDAADAIVRECEFTSR